jgi:hypothetical protein
MSDMTVQDEPEEKLITETESQPMTVAADSDAAARPAATTFTGDCVFNDNVTIFSGNRLPEYDKGPVKAYAARGTDKAPPKLIAYICEDHLSPRPSKAANYAAIMTPNLVRLVASGPVFWTPAGKEKYCFIYENTLGSPLMREDTRGGAGLRAEIVLNAIIRPMVSVLQDMRDKDLIHGNIRPANIFSGSNKNLDRVVLGECLALPPFYNQPVLYEPVDRAMASPIGRGAGSQQEDLYAFGVTLALLMRHNDPLQGKSDEEIIYHKMEEGTYASLLGEDRITGAMLELMRGLLYDDENQRWSLDEVLAWLDGRRLSPKQASRRFRAARPLHFNNEKYLRPELLAQDLSKNISEAKLLIDGGEMEQWISRAIDDKAMTARYENAVGKYDEEDKGVGHAERLTARVGIALHPEGPIRFKSINAYPDAIGTALQEAYVTKKDVQVFVDFFNAYFIPQWIDVQPRPVPDIGSLTGKFDGSRAHLRQKGMGGGIEKCIYSLNPEAQCLSEKLGKYYVRDPEAMMAAFEKISHSPGRPSMFFDRHIVAFLSVKDRKNIDPYIHDLNAAEPHRRILAEMKALATIQKRSQMGRFPGIAKWIVGNLGPVYERFHDRTLRAELKKKAEMLQDGGDLAKIAVLFDNPNTYQEDYQGFRKAMRRYFELEDESLQTERGLQNEKSFGQDTGRQIAAIVSGLLAAIVILLVVFGTFQQPTPF